MAHLLTGGTADRLIRGDDSDLLAGAMLGG